ncbi:MAG TPA: nucleotide-binding protein [Ornithinibacillus sp.]|nr:nucleotide-binding protein [Ornithinibacillus sp.]
MKRELELFGDQDEEVIVEEEMNVNHNEKNVFIVHGHDEALKQTVARTVDQIGLNSIILSEQDDDGKTVIEKFEGHASDCRFAIVLLSPDDIGYKRSDSPEKGAYRARQNVILELGYFIGKLSRKNVIAIVKDDPSGQLEIPSDIAGLLYTQFDNSDGWKLKLVKRLKACGYNVSADNL